MNSGTVRIENNTIFWDYENKNICNINLESIVVIGEYTVESLVDDWFMVFVYEDGSWNKISMFADNIQDLFDYLADNLNKDIKKTLLANSTKWDSVISYPNNLRGVNLFNLFKKEIILSNEVLTFISKKEII